MQGQHGQPEEVQEAIKMQERSHAIVMAALSDDDFMKGVLKARQAEAEGEQGESWPQVKARLEIV